MVMYRYAFIRLLFKNATGTGPVVHETITMGRSMRIKARAAWPSWHYTRISSCGGR